MDLFVYDYYGHFVYMIWFKIKIIFCEIKKFEITFYCSWMTVYCNWVNHFECVEMRMSVWISNHFDYFKK